MTKDDWMREAFEAARDDQGWLEFLSKLAYAAFAGDEAALEAGREVRAMDDE